jgi:hypothetical protein
MLRTTIKFATRLVGFLSFCAVALWLALTFPGQWRLAGPTSPAGMTVEVIVTDALAWNPGSDYYTDVAITRTGKDYQRFYWSDQEGQDSTKGVNLLLSSMKWVTPETLVFVTQEGKTIQITLSGNRWKLEELLAGEGK